MKKSFAVIFVLIIALSISSLAFAQDNKFAFFKTDTGLTTAGFDGGGAVTGIGGDQLVGFAIFVKNVDSFNSFSVDFTWDGTMAALDDRTSTAIVAGTVDINGEGIVLANEVNALTGSLIPVGESKEAGKYENNYAVFGSSSSSADYGFIYWFVLKTASSFTTNDSFTISAKVSIAEAGLEKYLGERFFIVNGATDVETKTWGEIKNQFKDF